MIRVYQYKLYPNQTQIKAMSGWMGTCCWLYNRALEHRIKAWKRRGESVSLYDQSNLLTQQRGRIESLRIIPVEFERDALRRADRGMKAFFRRCKAGEKPGFPRFRSVRRYSSLEFLAVGVYLNGNRIRVPKLGTVRCRGRLLPEGTQKALRVIRRASGWYAQIILDDGKQPPITKPIESAIGIDVGLTHFATLSTGDQIENPRFLETSQYRLSAFHRRVSRRIKGSIRRHKAVNSLRRQHERIADQRKYFCHQHSTALVRQFDLIAVEKLNVSGMSRSRFGKSILDAAWGMFFAQLVVKAAYAGRQVVAVNPRGTSQECPDCGRLMSKKLSERTHSCECGLTCHRDHASARVILARAVVATAATRPWTEPASDSARVAHCQVGRMKRVDRSKSLPLTACAQSVGDSPV